MAQHQRPAGRHPGPAGPPKQRMSRVERLHSERERRNRRFRNTMIIVSIAALVVLAAVGGILAYKFLAKADQPAPPKTYKLTIPEGKTVEETARIFDYATDGKISVPGFEAATEEKYDYAFLDDAKGNLEGFLYPKTYEVSSRTKPRKAVEMLLKQFEKETADLDWSRAARLGVTPYQVLIIASIIEREVSVPEERPIVASIIYNRLKNGMTLSFCSTVRYALDKWKGDLTDEDLAVDSPYNTYRHKGLPPAPICSPRYESMSAALNPAATDYLFMIQNKPGGAHSFTADSQQHLRWQQELQKKDK